MKPSDYELKLLRPLWKRKQLSAREIHDACFKETQWSYSATRKTLDRMVEKGLIEVEMVHGLKTFIPKQSKLETLAILASAFARDVLETDAPLPAAAFVNSKMVSKEEIKELQELLAKLSKENGGNDA